MLGPVWHPALLIRILLMTHILCLCSIALTWLKIHKYIFKDPLQVAHSSPCRRPMALHWSLCDVCAVSKLTFVQTEYCIFITEFKRQFHPPYLNQVESFLCFPDNMIIFLSLLSKTHLCLVKWRKPVRYFTPCSHHVHLNHQSPLQKLFFSSLQLCCHCYFLSFFAPFLHHLPSTPLNP